MKMNNDQSTLEQAEDTQKDKYLTFELEEQFYGIEIRHVTEIISIQTISEVPDLPPYMKGIINLRGKIIPVMDARIRFGKPVRAYNDRTCMIVIEWRGLSVGLIVDRVSEVLTIPEKEVVPPPEVGWGGNKYIQGIGKSGESVKLLLDCAKLLNENTVELYAGEEGSAVHEA